MDISRTLLLNNQVSVMSTERHPRKLKLVLIGNQHVGKTSLLQRYINGTYYPSYTHTRGGEIFQKEMVVDGRRIKLSLLDTAGQPDVRSLITSIYRDANGIMVVFDVTNEQSFDTVPDWIYKIEEHAEKCPQLVLVGNKDDLATHRKVENEQANKRAHAFSAPYYDVSAKTGYNVREAFEGLIKNTWKNLQTANSPRFTDTIRLDSLTDDTGEGSCCTS